MNFKKAALDYSGKNLTKFPEEIFTTYRVCKLNLSHNKIKAIPKEIEQLKFLETLELTGNRIGYLYAKLFELPNLKILILKDNEIVTIPKQIRNLQQLKILNLANNKLSELPYELTLLKNLEELNLSDNQLNDMPLHPGERYVKLKALWIAHNPLKNLTASRLLDGTLNLKSFYCYSTKLEKQVVSTDPIILKASRSKGNSFSILKEVTNYLALKDIPTIANDNVKPEHPMKPAKIFISYAHKNQEYHDRLRIHLRAMQHDIPVKPWSDTEIRSSDKWKEEIEKALDEATHAILLISPDFLASDFIRNNELPTLLKAAELKGTRIYPVIVQPCRFVKVKTLSDFQAVNNPDEPLSDYPLTKQDRIWNNLCDDIERYLEL